MKRLPNITPISLVGAEHGYEKTIQEFDDIMGLGMGRPEKPGPLEAPVERENSDGGLTSVQ